MGNEALVAPALQSNGGDGTAKKSIVDCDSARPGQLFAQ